MFSRYIQYPCNKGLFFFPLLFFREDDEDSEIAAGCSKLSKYFSRPSEPKKRHRYFDDKGLLVANLF